ncbi:RING-box protein 1a [Clonorchis sinensis]|uniref:RING-box protein 1a n=1 Tax=Clonorchis sinensis TaxID=79923 RepID=H2KVK8_CLOSI|nr:RING-box protein 1a [Clonorchis sinensis]
MLQECMLWRKKKPVGTTDVQREVDMGGSTQPPAGMDAAPTVDGAGSATNVAMDSTGLTDSAKEFMLLEAGGAGLTDLPPTSDAVSQRFQIKRWSACVYWSWDVMHDTCVICRNAMMSLCIHCQAKVGTNPLEEVCAIAWGVCNVRVLT